MDGVVRFLPGNQIWVPTEATNLQIRLVVIAHCGSAGHRGVQATLNALTERFTWKGITKTVQNFCKECLHCCVLRGGAVVPRTLGTATHASKPNKVIHFDFLHMSDLVDICDEHEYKELLIIKDDFSHFVNLVPCISPTAEVVALALQDWFSSYGVVPTWVSDQGSHFKNTVIRELNEKLGAEHKFSLPYCPWSNGTIERVNRYTLNVFRALLSEFRILPREWVRLKPLVQMSLNHTAVPSLGNLAPVTMC